MQSFDKIVFYVVAHADDWQLFMQPQAYTDLVTAGHKTIFIVTTAGDAGMHDKLWLAREEGLKSSVRFCVAPKSKLVEKNLEVQIGSRSITCWSIDSSCTYFLRLPDGGLDGNGFSAGLNQSLAKCHAGGKPMYAIDGSARYHNWEDLVATIELIFSKEMEQGTDYCSNFMDPRPDLNPGDHPDHMYTGLLMQAVPSLQKMQQRLFTGYSCCHSSGSLNPGELAWKSAMFAAYEKAVYDACGYSTLRENEDIYFRWLMSKASYRQVLPSQ